jgi:bifunctional non-homologous end joining protein LigD
LDEKRLAMATDDHPLEYLDFEGIIPKGQYGGGTVMVWDTGTYEIIDGNYYKGNLHLFLEGRKLKGEWMLVRDAGAGERKWQILKTGTPLKPRKKENVSAMSGRTMEQIADANDAEWHSNRTPTAHR